jgi:sialic acid synthase SpsE
MDRTGPDIVCSMDELATQHLIRDSKTIHLMLGGKKEAVLEEQVTIDFAYASVVSIKPIQKGETLTKKNVWVKRPGKDGISAELFDNILGRKACVHIENNVQIKWEMIQTQ